MTAKSLQNIVRNSIGLTRRAVGGMVRAAGKRRYVLLGESTHGTEEYYALRLEVTRRLVREGRFNTVLFEMEWPLGFQLNRYIHGGLDGHERRTRMKGGTRARRARVKSSGRRRTRRTKRSRRREKDRALKKLMRRLFVKFPKWMALNPYIYELIRFMRRWNDTHSSPSKKVYFYGVDCQDVELAKRQLADCGDPKLNCPIIRQIIDNYEIMTSRGANYWNRRDTFWHTIIKSIRAQRRSKFVLWAHNSHIGNNQANVDIGNKINIGVLLDEAYRNSVYKIGFSTYEGAVRAATGWGEAGRVMRLKKAHPQSWEHLFKLAAEKLAARSKKAAKVTKATKATKAISGLIYTPPTNPASETQKLYFRYVGVVYSPTSEMTSHYQKTNLDREYDKVIFIPHTHALPTSLLSPITPIEFLDE